MCLNKTVKSCIFIALIILTFPLCAQEFIIKGTVIDSKINQPLAFCTIVIQNTAYGTQTDNSGKFEITIPNTLTSSKMIISYIGYFSDTLALDLTQTVYHILLNPSENSLNEIVVKGLSNESSILENPVITKLVSKKAIEQTTESNIIDILSKNTPGLNAVKTGPNVSKPYIRGLGYNRLVTLFDGVPVEGQQFEDEEVLAVDMYSIESAEILLGPVSLQYGAEAIAGVINLIPSKPITDDKKIHGRFISEYQHNNRLVGNGLRLNYGNKHWSFITRGAYRIAKNYSNKIDGKVYNTGFREINTSGSVAYKSNKGYSDLNFSFYDNSQGIPDGSRDSLTRKFTKAIYDDPLDDLVTRPIVSDKELNSYALSSIYQHIRHFSIYNKNDYQIKDRDRLYSMIAFQQNQRKEYDFPEQKNLTGVSMRLNTLNYDFRYEINKFSNIDISAGMNGAYQNNKNINAHDIPIPNYNLFDFGAYVMSKWKYKKWIVSSGIRFDSRYITGHDFYTREDSATELLSQVSLPDTANAELLFPKFKRSYIGSSFNLGVSFLLSKNIILKMNLAQGFRPPHVSEFASNGLDGSAHSYFIGKDDLKSEYNWQIDFGAEFNLKDVSFSFNLFNNFVKNYIYLVQLVDENGEPIELIEDNKTFQYQQSNAELVGLENIINVHPKIMKGFNFITNLSLVYGFNMDNKYKGMGTEGQYLPSIPPLKLLTVISQDIKIKSKILPVISLRAEGDFNAKQTHYLSLNETETKTPAYFLLNASVNFSFNYTKKSTLQLQFQVNNILNKSYQSNLSRLKYFEYYSESTNGYSGIYNMGRNISVKLILPF